MLAGHLRVNGAIVGPSNSRSDGYRERLQPKDEIVDFYGSSYHGLMLNWKVPR